MNSSSESYFNEYIIRIHHQRQKICVEDCGYAGLERGEREKGRGRGKGVLGHIIYIYIYRERERERERERRG
jgi:hypothetical protein